MTKKQKVDWKVILGGMACLTVVELYALNQGIDGVLLTTFVAIIAAAIGVTIPNPLKK